MKQSGKHLKGKHLIANTRCPTRVEVATFISLNGGRLTHSVASPAKPAGRYHFAYKCRRGHPATNTLYDFRRERWCKGCTWNRLTHAECVAYATNHEGRLLSAYCEAIKDTDTLEFTCKRNHHVSLTGTDLKKGRWCRDCDRLARRIDESLFKEQATSRGGLFLGRDDAAGCNTLRFRCSAGHEFPLLVANFRYGKWCSQCSSGLGERIVRVVVETLLGGAFPRLRPAWLEMGPRSLLELDGYNAEQQIAFEHHGRQHYGIARMRFPTDYESQRKRDAFKRKQCVAHGVRLIEVPEVFGLTPLSEVKNVVVAECRRLGIRIPRDRLGLRPAVEAAYRTQSLDDTLGLVRKTVSEKGGTVLAIKPAASGTANLIPVHLDCGRGHQWLTRVGLIVRGHWCRTCYRNDRDAFLDGEMTPEEYGRRYGVTEPRGIRINVDDVRSLALECGLTLLSHHYRSAKRKVRFRCHHCRKLFPLSYDQLKQRRPDRCPPCAHKRNGLARRHTVEELQSLAHSNRGYLLSWEYHGVCEPLRWWCSGCEGSFVRPADPILQGGWCPRCSRREGGKKQSATKRANKLTRWIAKIRRHADQCRWTIKADLEDCMKGKKVVSLVCEHHEPFKRSVAYLLRKKLQCDCQRSNSSLRGQRRLEATLTSLGWELVSPYVDRRSSVKVKCHHGKVFDRNAGQITRKAQCECEKRSASGEKYISPRPNGRFQVSVVLGYKSHCLGTFNTREEAVQVRDEFCQRHGKIL